MSKSVNLTEDDLNFISFMKENTIPYPKLKDKLDICLRKIYSNGEQPSSQNKDLESVRKNHNPAITADFFSLFSSSDGFKFLTHDFDPDSGLTMETVIKQAEEILFSKKYKFQIPRSLYSLINGFINGPKWTDNNGEEHHIYLKSKDFRAWINTYPSLHPISSNKYGSEVQIFRNTVRIFKPKLQYIFTNITSSRNNLKSLNLIFEKLDKADFYTNVYYLGLLCNRVLADIAQREYTGSVRISYSRSVWNEYRLHEIRFTHIGTEANSFDDVKNKFFSGGGALFGFLNFCQGYCDWTIEANFEGEFKRWRILNYRNLPEVETLTSETVEGFTHIFTFYKYK